MRHSLRESGASSTDSRSHVCKQCLRSYAKAEHLARHERTHTGAKPYSCPVCNKHFSRQDSLARHSKIHANRRLSEVAAETTVPEVSNELPPPSSVLNDVVPPVDDFHDQSLATTFAPTDFETHLEWPDAEGLLQTIVSADFNSWSLPPGALPFSQADWTFTPGSSNLQDAVPSGDDSTRGGHRAVQDLSQMILNLPLSIAVDAESFTSVFIDQCFHEFWDQFLPVFPVIHRPTFVFKDCSQPLLLNAIALGSLFLARKDAQVKGQALWRLAHMAVATSWQSLITHRGPYDSRPGVQLVLTAVLGQCYAILSKDRNMRMTARVFHAMGFGWARHCGLHDSDQATSQDIPSLDAPDKDEKWRAWTARQIQHRSLLATYILDGQLSHFAGSPTSVRHSTNHLFANVPDAAFEAPTADDWIHAMSGTTSDLTFTTIFSSLIFGSDESLALTRVSSVFSVAVILEGMQSICCESEEAGGVGVGTPAMQDIRQGLYAMYPYLLHSSQHSPAISDTLVRWHLLCLERATGTANLCRALCLENKIKQYVYGGSDLGFSSSAGSYNPALKLLGGMSTREWTGTLKARQALLHAAALHRLLEKTPLDRAQGMALPGAIFASATVYAAFAINGIYTLTVPKDVDWADALDVSTGAVASSPAVMTETRRFLVGSDLSYGASGAVTNMFYDLNTVQNVLRRLCPQWGVSVEMDEVLDKWIALCH